MTDERRAADLPVAELAFPGPLRDELVAGILREEKAATAGLLAEFEREGEPLRTSDSGTARRCARRWESPRVDVTDETLVVAEQFRLVEVL